MNTCIVADIAAKGRHCAVAVFRRDEGADLMRDPHVDTLLYKVSSEEGISYATNPESLSVSTDLGTFNLTDGMLRVVPVEHFTNEEEARQAIDPFLRAWEIEADITSHIGMIRFQFASAEIIDRNPPPPGSSQVIEVRGTSMGVVGCSASMHLTCARYPKPPTIFRVTTEVQRVYRRWRSYHLGKEPLHAMAYFVLTQLQHAAGNRRMAASSFKIDMRVLEKIGELSSTKGGESTARKAPSDNKFQELSDSEKHWLDQAIRKVIYRLGEHASGGPLTQISLNDLPPL